MIDSDSSVEPPSITKMRPPAATGGAVTWVDRAEGAPYLARQATVKLAPAAAFSTDCSGVPPGSGQSAMGAGSGR